VITLHRTGRIGYDRTRIMGILNVTPDSFADGTRYYEKGAVEHALKMIQDGADIIDVGGESTRPGFEPITAEEEIRRVIPVIRRISEVTDIPISADTVKAKVAEAAINAGADIVNDVSGSSEEMMKVVSDLGAALVITHVPADILNVHGAVMHGDVIEQIRSFFRTKTEAAATLGIPEDRIILDPGIGFGKTMEQNFEILNRVSELCGEFPILIGASMKRFLSTSFPEMSKEDASIEAAVIAASKGASIVRVHDVKRSFDALRQMK